MFLDPKSETTFIAFWKRQDILLSVRFHHRWKSSSSTLIEDNYLIYGGDAKDAYAHSPPPSIPTFVSIDDQYAEWYEWKFGVKLDRKKVLPVQHALQGHPESGKLWERTINKVLRCPRLNFQTTVHDRTVYWTTFRGVKVYLLRQVDDFALASPSEDIAKEIFQIIGEELKFAKEDEIPLEYLGLLDDFNGVKIQQSAENVVLSAEGYIERVLRLMPRRQ